MKKTDITLYRYRSMIEYPEGLRLTYTYFINYGRLSFLEKFFSIFSKRPLDLSYEKIILTYEENNG